MRRIAAMAAIAALGFAGCGGDDEEPTAASESTPAAESTPTPESTPSASTLQIEADPGGENAFTETELTADAGEVTVEFKNPSQKPHAVVIEGVEPATETVTDADAPAITVSLEAGEYTFFCPVGDHRADGMEGKLTVR